MTADPHRDQPVLHAGVAPARARLAIILVHGRGGSPDDMLALAQEFTPADIAYYAPQAAGSTWYPYSFLAPTEQNEPGITSGLAKIASVIASLAVAGIGEERVVLLGFSQGACLALEFAARHPRPYAAIVGLSGGLIGPPGTPREYAGRFGGTSVFLGCSDVDPHIPVERVHETAEVFQRMDATVDMRIYPRMGHTVNRDEIDAINLLIAEHR